MNKRILSFLLLFMMLFTLAMPAYGADNAASVTTSMKGNDVTIAVKDGLAVVTTVVAYAKNTTQTYDVEGYKVTIEYNGSGVKKASITGYPSTSANAPAAAPASPAPSENTPAPKPGVSVSGANMTWNKADEAAAKAFTQSASKDTAVPLTALIPVNSKKTDASGDKIPSNAHSGDYPGIYFYWNDKQKDDGILKVDPALFDLFKDGKFYITAKNSNAYWDYWISPDDPKAAVTSEGYLLYQIPRYFMYSDKNNKITKDELKNINMIFIGGDYKDAFLIIEKDWFDEDGNLVVDKTLIGELNKKLSFDSNAGKLKLGLNTIKITDFSSAYFGKKLTVSEGAIAGYKTKLNPITLTVKYNDVPVKSITFENQKLWAFIKISKAWDLLPGSTAPGAKFNIYDMNDNLLYEGVGPGTYQVKEGTYKVAEIAISGFTADKESATITVDAGKTGTVSFKNKEDRATITPIKMWVGDELPAGVEAKLTNGYTFGETKTVKAGTNVAFEEEAIDFVIVDDFIYTFELESIALAKGSDAAQVVSVVDFTAEKDVAYTVYFSNKVTKKPLAADLTIVKVWQDENGEPLDKTGLFATVDSDIVFTAPYVLGLNEDVVHGLDLATIEEDIGACAYEDSEYWYTFEQVGVSGNDRIVGPGGSYTITFTNKLVKTPKPADLTIVKVWQDENGGLLGKTGVFATVDADIAFTAPYVLGLNSNVALGLDLATIAEDLSACAYEDSEYWYAFEQVGVSGNSGIVGPGGSYTVTFTNKLVKTPKPADLTIVKVWQDENGGALDKTGVFATVDADIAFTAPYVLGLNSNVALGLDLATIAENLGACAYEDSEYWYAFTQVGVAGNSGIVGPGGSYTVTFTNKLVKVPKPADLTIVKVWQDENGAPLDKTDVFATVDADITFTAPYVLGLNSNVALGLDLATIAENLGACAYEDSEYWYTFAQVGIAGNSGIVGPGGSYTVTFTNKLVKAPKPAKVTIVKNWLDENGEPLNKTGVFATVDADILFSDFNLGENLNIPAGQSYTVTENLANCAYEDSGYWYSFEQVGVNGNVFTTAPGGAHTVTFTNKLVKIPKPAKVTIVKNWLNENGGPLDKTGVFATVDADISFSAPFVLGVNNNVALGTSLAVTEDVTACAYEDTGYWYSFEQVAVTGNSGIVAAGGDYTVTFTNKLVKTPKPAKVTIVKIWQDENGGPLSKTGLFADVDVDISFTAPFVLGVNNDVALGTDLSNLVEDVTACAYQDAGYWYSFVQVAVSGNDGIVAAGGDYTVTFTNKLVKIPKPAKVTIVKIWQDENGGSLNKTGVFSTVDTDISFTAPFVLGENNNVALGTDLSNLAEDVTACAYQDEGYWYSFVQVAVSGNSGIVAAGGDYTVTFTNKLVKIPKPAKVTIVKIWQDENGGSLNKTGVFSTVDTDISFSAPFVLGVNNNVALGTSLAVTEDVTACAYEDASYWYSFVQVAVSGNSGIVAAGGDYTVTFTNKLVKTPKPAKVTIVKNWQDVDGSTLSKTGLFANVDSDISFSAPFVLGVNNDVALGTSLAVTEDVTACAYEDASYWYSFVQVAVSGNSGVVGPGGDYTVTFTNKLVKTPKPAKVTIVKNWQDVDGSALTKTGLFANVDSDIAFTAPFVLGANNDVALGTDLSGIAEDVTACAYQDEGYWYSFEQVAVSGNSGTVDPGGDYTVTFTNKLVKTPKPAKVTIVKNWQDENGDSLNKTGVFSTVDTDILFTAPFVLGENNDVALGTDLSGIAEDVTACAYQDANYWYSFVQVAVSGNSGTVDPGGDYTVTFTNKLVKAPKPADVVVTKAWTGEFANLPLAQQTALKDLLEFDASFSFVLGESQKIPAGTALSIKEVPKTWSFDASTATHTVIYTVVWDAAEYSATTAPGGSNAFAFTNNVVKTMTPKPATLLIEKVWTGAALPAGIEATLTNGYVFGNQSVPGESNVAFAENAIAGITLDGYDYTFDFVSVTIDSGAASAVNSVDFTAAPGGSHKVVITNNVVKTPKPATVIIVKNWQDENGNALNKTGVFATVDNDIAFTAPFVLGENNNVPEGFNLATIVENISACNYEDASYWYSFTQVGVSGNAGIAAAGGNYTITFTNKLVKTPKSANVTIVKNWLDDSGAPLSKAGLFANVDSDIKFTSPFVLGANINVALGTDLATIAENLNACKYEDADYWYSFVQVGVSGNSGIVGPGGSYTVTFTNKLVKEEKPDPTIVVVKNWVDKNGRTITDPALIAELASRLSFTNNYGIGFNAASAGTITVQENQINEFTINGVTYTVAFKSANVTETGGNVPYTNVQQGVSFAAAKGKNYTIRFVNEVDTKTYDSGNDFIPSKQHFDRWWNYGVLCYSSSTDKDVNYFIAFDANFWDRNEYAIIGFGNNANSIVYEAYFDIGGWKIIQTSNGSVVNSGSYLDPFTVPSSLFPGHYFRDGNGTYGNYQTDPMIGTTTDLGLYFANVFGSGGRQAYRLTIKPLVIPVSSLSQAMFSYDLPDSSSDGGNLIVSYWNDESDLNNEPAPAPFTEIIPSGADAIIASDEDDIVAGADADDEGDFVADDETEVATDEGDILETE